MCQQALPTAQPLRFYLNSWDNSPLPMAKSPKLCLLLSRSKCSDEVCSEAALPKERARSRLNALSISPPGQIGRASRPRKADFTDLGSLGIVRWQAVKLLSLLTG